LEAIKKIIAVSVVFEYLPAFDATDNYVVQNTGSIQAG
jgi:hypothetical protein